MLWPAQLCAAPLLFLYVVLLRRALRTAGALRQPHLLAAMPYAGCTPRRLLLRSNFGTFFTMKSGLEYLELVF